MAQENTLSLTLCFIFIFSHGVQSKMDGVYNELKARSNMEHNLQDIRSTTCPSPIALGMENHEIPDSAITASSWLDYNTDFYGPQFARLNMYPLGPWVKHQSDTAPWIQVDLGDDSSGIVIGVQTQGSASDKHVTAFKVRSGLSSCNMEYIKDTDGATKIFSSPSSAVTTHNFPEPVNARFVRLEPTAWNEYCALRFEILGCPARPRCAPDWDGYDGGACFYFDHTARLTYSQAKAACQSKGAKLTSIHSQSEQEFLADVECFTLDNAADYRGYVSQTQSGKTCQKWTSQTPHSHSSTPEDYPNAGLGDHNYCRNPDGESSAWCYTTDPNDRWDLCDVGEPRNAEEECIVRIQENPDNDNDGYFIGLDDIQTENTFRWSDGTQLDFTYWQSGEPNGGDQDCVALWPHGGGKWRDYRCYGSYSYICKTQKGTVCPTGFEEFQANCYYLNHDAKVSFNQAKIECQNKGAEIASIHSEAEQLFLADVECYTDPKGQDYRGFKSTTISGKTCQKWTSQTPHEHSRTPENYPNGGLGDHNYCRNPDGESSAWCYTIDPNDRWDWCDVGEPQTVCNVRIKKDPNNLDDGYFVGLNDQTNEGTFVWSDGTQVDYTNWASEEPDNYGVDEDCVALWPHAGGKWKDDQCSTHSPYICRKDREIPLSIRTATQSSTHPSSPGPPGRAIDGDTNPLFSGNSCTNTDVEYGAWWMVDQLFNECVGTVAIYNRQDCCKQRLVGAFVRVGPNPDRNNPVCGSPLTLDQVNANDVVEVNCNLRGRYISISLPGTEQLTLCEVKTYLGKCSAGIDITSPFTPAGCTSPTGLGMENGQISDDLITASTVFSNSYQPFYARLDGSDYWVAHRSDSKPWIQVDLFGSSSNAVSGVITQGSPSYDEWTTLFSVQVGDNVCSLQYILGSDNAPKIFNGNSDRDTKITNTFPATIKARIVRILPVNWKAWASMRFEVLGCRL